MTEDREPLTATSVVIGGSLALTPERYHEDDEQGAMIIELLTTTTGDDTEALEAAITGQRPGAYYSVVREGISHEPLEMRFGKQCLWEQQDSGRRHLLTLVERRYDDGIDNRRPFVAFHEPELDRALEAIAALQVIVDALVDTTVEAGLMSAADAASLHLSARDGSPSGLRRFRRAEKLDEHWRHD